MVVAVTVQRSRMPVSRSPGFGSRRYPQSHRPRIHDHLGFAIWATEFPWANAVAKFVRRQITRCASWIKRQPHWLLVAAGSLCLVAVALLVVVLLLALL